MRRRKQLFWHGNTHWAFWTAVERLFVYYFFDATCVRVWIIVWLHSIVTRIRFEKWIFWVYSTFVTNVFDIPNTNSSAIWIAWIAIWWCAIVYWNFCYFCFSLFICAYCTHRASVQHKMLMVETELERLCARTNFYLISYNFFFCFVISNCAQKQ